MTGQIKIRAQVRGSTTEIRILLQHPMETGMRKDERGQALPMHFIQLFNVFLNGMKLVDGQLNTSISKNPLFAFKAQGVKAGDKLSVTWTDNLGEHQQDEIVVA